MGNILFLVLKLRFSPHYKHKCIKKSFFQLTFLEALILHLVLIPYRGLKNDNVTSIIIKIFIAHRF